MSESKALVLAPASFDEARFDEARQMAVIDDPMLHDRYWAKVSPEPNTGCWLWLGSMVNGYGTISGGPRGNRFHVRAHRFFYQNLIGEIPEGLDLDHLCRVRCCVNPAHLEPVTRAENLRRSPITAHARKYATHCKRGHEFTEENTYRTDRQRACRACERLRYQERRAGLR